MAIPFGLSLSLCLLLAGPASTRAGSGPNGAYVQARGDSFEIVAGAKTYPFFIRGVNLGAGSPGHFPGEFAITKADYRRWLRFARTLRANAVRVYALHPPEFYQALKEENDAHPKDPIWLFQEVWTELPERNDFMSTAFTRGFDFEIKTAIDAVHGSAFVAPRPGRASGQYTADASPYIAGWLLGREWEPYAVRVTQQKHPDATTFKGGYFAVDEGTAMEVWLAKELDLAAGYEAERYGVAHALSFVNWPTLDPMRHPTEYERGGRESEHDEDAYSVDPARIRLLKPPGLGSRSLGYFANYHVYPYYPDFMNLDPGYAAFRDQHGPCNYAGYLTDLKAHTRGLPLLIGEFGVPASRGVAHQQPQGIDHGGMSEAEQGRQDARLLEDIQGTGCAGSLLFALFDEWFKVNWLVMHLEQPRDRDPLWHNLLDPEENYGLMGFDPPPSIRVDGKTDDWNGIKPYAADSTGQTLRALFVSSDQDRLYLRLDLAATPSAKKNGRNGKNGEQGPPQLGVALDVLDAARGDRRLPAPLQATWSRGAEFVLLVDPGDPEHRSERPPRAELFIDRSMNWSLWSRLLIDGRFERDRAPFRPVANENGLYAPLLVETNRERVARNGRVFAAKCLDWGRLEFGREPAFGPAWAGADTSFAYDPHAEWTVDDAGRTIEIAIPWGLLNVGDPSSLAVVDDRDGTREVESTRTEGIGLLAWGTRVPGFRPDSLGPARPGWKGRIEPQKVQFLGPDGTTQVIVGEWVQVTTPAAQTYVWKGWEMPMTQERIKQSAALVRQVFEGMEARDQRHQTTLDAQRK
jgi:hypothetical protein